MAVSMQMQWMLRMFPRSLLYFFPPLLVCVALVAKSVFSYSWSSNFMNLACSIQDDSFYYFIPAWNGAHGSGLTFGGEKTSGFQPLYEALLTFFSLFCTTLESLVRVAINLNGWLFALTALTVGLAAGRLIDAALPGMRRTAVALSMSVAALSFLCLHTVFFSSLTGKENALAAFLLAAIIWTVLAKVQNRSTAAVTGLLCGLLLLTRISPASFLYVGIALILVQGRIEKAFAVGACLLPVIAWTGFAHLYFGHVLPMSMLVKMHASSHVSALHAIKSGFEYVVESVKFSLSAHSRFNLLQLQAREGTRSFLHVAAMVAALGGSVFGMSKCLLRQRSRAILCLAMFGVGGVSCSLAFGALQAGRSDDMYYTVWYVYDLPVLVALNCGFAVAWLQSEFATFRSSSKVTAAVSIACLLYFFGDIAWYFHLKPYDASDDARFAASWQGKKIEVADWFRANVTPTNPHYKVATFSAGAFSYYLFDHVVNLDGLANNAAGEALIATHSVVDYVKALRPDYLIEVCRAEKEFDNLQRLHFVAFPKQDGYCIDRFIYE
jgi:hypothetical protein